MRKSEFFKIIKLCIVQSILCCGKRAGLHSGSDCLPHLTLQLRDSFSKLSLSCFWKLRVETLREASHSVLLVLVLEKRRVWLISRFWHRWNQNSISPTTTANMFSICECANEYWAAALWDPQNNLFSLRYRSGIWSFLGHRSDIVNDSSPMHITNSLRCPFDPVSDANRASDECRRYKNFREHWMTG